MQSALQDEIDTLRRRYRSESDPAGLAFASLADAYRRAGEMDEAWALLTEGLEEHPDFATGHLVAARVLRDRGERAEAVERYGRVLRLDSQNREALLEAAALAQHEGRIRDALALCQRLALVDPSDADLRARIRTLKEVHFTSGELEAVAGVEEEAFPMSDEVDVEEEVDVEDERGVEDERDVEEAGDEEEEPSAFGDVWTGDTWTDEPWAPHPEEAGAEDEGTSEEPGDESETWMDAEPAAEPERADEDPLEPGLDEEGGAEVHTRTMADLYARQGHVERALKIYGHLLDREPGDEALRERIRELEEEEATPGTGGRPIAAYFESLLEWKGRGGAQDRSAGEEGA